MSMREENAGKHERLGVPDKVTIHWTAGNYSQTFDHYHYNIQGDGTVIETLPVKYKGSHTWKRNSNNIGVTMCCMYSNKFPPTKKQIEATAKLVADLVDYYNIPWENVKDHAYYARLDGYSNLRWDVGSHSEQIISKAKWYKNRLVTKVDTNSIAARRTQ